MYLKLLQVIAIQSEKIDPRFESTLRLIPFFDSNKLGFGIQAVG